MANIACCAGWMLCHLPTFGATFGHSVLCTHERLLCWLNGNIILCLGVSKQLPPCRRKSDFLNANLHGTHVMTLPRSLSKPAGIKIAAAKSLIFSPWRGSIYVGRIAL